MKQMMEKHESISEALDATAKIMEEAHIRETILMINSGKIHLGNLKTYIDKLNPVNPGDFAWKVLTGCSRQGSPGPDSPGCWRCFRRDAS